MAEHQHHRHHQHHWFWHQNKANPRASLHKLLRSRSGLHGSPSTGQITNKLVSETFWPDSLDRESTKAARILYSFCKYGMYQDEVRDNSNQTTQKQKMWSRIPQDVIANAKGLAIFTVMRAGLWVSGAGGSGVVVARTPKGSWSWPAAIELQTAELGFLIGGDIYDCVLALNTTEAVEAFSKSRCIIGGDLYATPGPLGVGWFFDKDARSQQAPIFSYLRSRGYYAAVQLDHAVVVSRTDENRSFYQLPNLAPKDIFTGDHAHRPASCLSLLETLKASEGNDEIDEALLASGPPPSAFEVVEEGHAFGVPDKEDPDPYGVLALEKQGLVIREAGTKTSPGTESFEFNPSITSPVFAKYNRRSADGTNISVRSSWRRSVHSTGDRNDASSVISRDTDQDSLPPASPGLNQNFRSIQFAESENKPVAGIRNLTNGQQPSSDEANVKRESIASRLQRSNSRQQTIYEDIHESNPTPHAGIVPLTNTSIVDNMVDELQGRDKELHLDDPATPIQLRHVAGDEIPQSEEQLSIKNDLRDISGAEHDPSVSNLDDEKEISQKPLEIQTTQIDEPADHRKSAALSLDGYTTGNEEPAAKSMTSVDESGAEGDDDDDGFDDDDEYVDPDSEVEEPNSPVEIHDVVYQSGGAPSRLHQGASSVIMPKPRIVNVAKPAPPVVPTRNPGRVATNAESQSSDERPKIDSAEHEDPPSLDESPTTEVSPPGTPYASGNITATEHNEPVSPVESLDPSIADEAGRESNSRPVDGANKKPEVKTSTLMDIHKGLSSTSPISEASSPEHHRSGYFQ